MGLTLGFRYRRYRPSATSRFLKAQYNRFNHLWFASRLPDNTEVVWVPPLRGYLGYTSRRTVFRAKEGRKRLLKIATIYRIEISRALKKFPTSRDMTLLHEMAHIALPWGRIDHGPRFNREMRRLAAKGAFDGLW